jgi:hypothetical protein
MMGGETPETCWATHKRQAINLWNCCILLVELFESNDITRFVKTKLLKKNIWSMHYEILHFMWETKRTLRKVIPRTIKVYSWKRLQQSWHCTVEIPWLTRPQYTIMSPLQSKCQPSNAFHPAAAEQYHLTRSYVSSSLSHTTDTEDWNPILMLSTGEYFETTHSWLVHSIWF